jgi:hypothetical protein
LFDALFPSFADRHYLPYKEGTISDVELSQDELIVQHATEGDVSRVKILSEETAYNSDNREFKILIVEQPLIAIDTHRPNESGDKSALQESIAPCPRSYTYEECRSYLKQRYPSKFERIADHLNSLVRRFTFLPGYLDNATQTFKNWVFSVYVQLTDDVLEQPKVDFDPELVMIINCFVMGITYSYLSPVTRQEYEEEDADFVEKCKQMLTLNFRPVDLGANPVFANFVPSKGSHQSLLQMFELDNAFLKIQQLKLVLEEMSSETSRFIEANSYPFLKNKPQVLSDDLVAITILKLIDFVTKNSKSPIISEMKFIEHFSCESQDKNEFGYSFVTFQVAVEYISKYKISEVKKGKDHLKPRKTAPNKPCIMSNSDLVLPNNSVIDRAIRDLDQQALRHSPKKVEFNSPLDDLFNKLSMTMKEDIEETPKPTPKVAKENPNKNLGYLFYFFLNCTFFIN